MRIHILLSFQVKICYTENDSNNGEPSRHWYQGVIRAVVPRRFKPNTVDAQIEFSNGEVEDVAFPLLEEDEFVVLPERVPPKASETIENFGQTVPVVPPWYALPPFSQLLGDKTNLLPQVENEESLKHLLSEFSKQSVPSGISGSAHQVLLHCEPVLEESLARKRPQKLAVISLDLNFNDFTWKRVKRVSRKHFFDFPTLTSQPSSAKQSHGLRPPSIAPDRSAFSPRRRDIFPSAAAASDGLNDTDSEDYFDSRESGSEGRGAGRARPPNHTEVSLDRHPSQEVLNEVASPSVTIDLSADDDASPICNIERPLLQTEKRSAACGEIHEAAKQLAEPSPPKKPSSFSSSRSEASMVDFHDADDVVVVVNPVNTQVELSPAEASADDEVSCVGATGVMNLPHARMHCTRFPFNNQEPTDSSHSKYCSECYCWLCEVLASKCVDWCAHCQAFDRSPYWKSERRRLIEIRTRTPLTSTATPSAGARGSSDGSAVEGTLNRLAQYLVAERSPVGIQYCRYIPAQRIWTVGGDSFATFVMAEKYLRRHVSGPDQWGPPHLGCLCSFCLKISRWVVEFRGNEELSLVLADFGDRVHVLSACDLLGSNAVSYTTTSCRPTGQDIVLIKRTPRFKEWLLQFSVRTGN